MSRSSSRVAASRVQPAVGEEEAPGQIPETHRPTRSSALAVRTLLQQIRVDESDEDTYEETGLTTAVEESQAEAGFADDDDNGEEDLYQEMAAVVDLGSDDEHVERSIHQFALEKPKKPVSIKAKRGSAATKDLSSDESSNEEEGRTLLKFGDAI